MKKENKIEEFKDVHNRMLKEKENKGEVEHLQSKYALDEHFSKEEKLRHLKEDDKFFKGLQKKENKPLGEKEQELEGTCDSEFYFKKDVKEKIQNVQRRIKLRIKKRCYADEDILLEELNQIFLEEIGGKLI